MASRRSEYEVEDMFIERLEGIGYQFIKMSNYDDVLNNFRTQLAKFNAKKLEEAGYTAAFSDAEFQRILIHVENHSVYESAQILRDKYVLEMDDGNTVYIDFFSSDTTRNIYQVTHQVTMDPDHKNDVVYKNRYDVTVLINGLPIVQIELKRPGVEINEAIKQGNNYYFYHLTYEIKNDARLKLPSTGGFRNIKTYLPLIGGSVLILIAAYFVLKRKYQN